MVNILEKIATVRRQRLEREKKAVSLAELECIVAGRAPALGFASALSEPGVHIIAEIKKASPSKGDIAPGLDPAATAKSYVEGGASAISVLTEQDHFKGSINDLAAVRKAVDKPILRKDFILDEYQILESRAHGADSFLLISGFLDGGTLARLLKFGRSLGMEPLVETHEIPEIDIALEADARIIGVNNRNLKTFSTSLDVTLRAIEHIPRDKIVVSESGIKTREDILKTGASVFLIGETLVRSPDPGTKIRELLGR
jgi:indole-3-glycerol phosphate synthase